MDWKPKQETVLAWFAISVAAYVGSFFRIALTYLRPWSSKSDFTSIIAQIVGCILMGLFTHHRKYLSTKSSRFHDTIYIGLTSGLCGSITTFSTWNIQCTQACLFDDDSQSSFTFATRIITWLVCLWTCMAISINSLHVGHYLATFSSLSDRNLPTDPTPSDESPTMPPPPPPQTQQPDRREVALALVFVATTAAVAAAAAQGGRGGRGSGPRLAIAAALGAVGAALRFHLATLNRRNPQLPPGTLAANTLATWLLAGLTALSAAGGGEPDDWAGAARYGAAAGLCGCLSTVSTLANELDALPAPAGYRYAAASLGLAQAGALLILAGGRNWMMPPYT